MISKRISILAAAIVCVASGAAGHVQAQDAQQSPDAIYKQVESTFGAVPTFLKQVPKAALPGYWTLERDLELSDKTALDAKTKALISLAVASQIPCQYCIWADTNTLRQMGASDEEIAEAVSMAALTRYSSTTFNGLQVDFEQFKKDLGGSK
ncbi:MAG TPA: carboxymuconolactone decarboxylase family protein [Bryobacteraceae bacterium]|nr:carboxymuconolactone decarboxylase family protein [Bryobacteraceae bacterium]